MTEPRYYISQVDLRDGTSYTSLHETRAGAEQRMLEWLGSVGLEAPDYYGIACISAVRCYKISRLPLRP